MSKLVLIPANLVSLVLDNSPELKNTIYALYPDINQKELTNPKEPIKNLFLAFIAYKTISLKEKTIQELFLKTLPNLCRDIEINDLVEVAKKIAMNTKSSHQFNQTTQLKTYCEQLQIEKQQLEAMLNDDHSTLISLSKNLENITLEHRIALKQAANALNIALTDQKTNELVSIYGELKTRTRMSKEPKNTHFNSDHTTSLAQHLLNPKSELSNICDQLLNHWQKLKEDSNKILVRYFIKIDELQEILQKPRHMTWATKAFLPAPPTSKSIKI